MFGFVLPITLEQPLWNSGISCMSRFFGRRTYKEDMLAWGVSALAHVLVIAIVSNLFMHKRPVYSPGGEAGVEIVFEQDSARGGSNVQAGASELAGDVSAGDISSLAENVDAELAEMGEVTDLPVGAVSGQVTASVMRLNAGGAVGNSSSAQQFQSLGTMADGSAGSVASFFGVEAKGDSFVYVVDCSSSMMGKKLWAAKSELARSVATMDRRMKFFIIFYNTKHYAMGADGLVRASEQNKSLYFKWVDSVNSGGGTDPSSAMEVALSLRPDAIWLLSDGEFDEQVCEVIRNNNPRRKVQVNTIAFYSQSGQGVLKRIAFENEGKYRFVAGQ